MTTETMKDKLEVLTKQFDLQKQYFINSLPQNCSYEKFVGIITSAIVRNPELLKADRAKFINCCRDAAQDGLLLNNREAALIIYKGSVSYIPMIGGIFKKINNSGALLSISAHIVGENDEFDYCLGDDEFIKHKPNLDNPGKPILVYAIAKTKDGGIYREIMTLAQINKIKSASPAQNGPWVNYWDEMAKKTIIRRLSKRLPMSSDIERVLTREDDLYDFANQIENMPVPKSSAIDYLNNQVLDIGDAPEVEDVNNLRKVENETK